MPLFVSTAELSSWSPPAEMGHGRMVHTAQKAWRGNEATVHSLLLQGAICCSPGEPTSPLMVRKRKTWFCSASAEWLCKKDSQNTHSLPTPGGAEWEKLSFFSLSYGSREHNQKWAVPCWVFVWLFWFVCLFFNSNRMLFLIVASMLTSILLQTKWNYYETKQTIVRQKQWEKWECWSPGDDLNPLSCF